MSNIEKPSASLEKTMQKYFKLFAIVLIVFVTWRMFSPENVQSTFSGAQSVQGEALKALVSQAVEEALNKRDIPVHASTHEPSVQTNGDVYTINIPKQALQAASGDVVVRNSNAVFTINFTPVIEKSDAENEKTTADDVKNETVPLEQKTSTDQPTETGSKPE